MEDQDKPTIIAAERRDLWRLAEPSIWALKEDHAQDDPALSILRTLLDQPPWLEAYHLYDERGSQLFEQICALPEYYLTRTENSILAGQAERMIAAAPVDCIVELGAGTSEKTLHLLREQVRQRPGGTFAPIDVSLRSLALSRDAVGKRFPQLTFHGLLARYEEGFSSICLSRQLGRELHPGRIRPILSAPVRVHGIQRLSPPGSRPRQRRKYFGKSLRRRPRPDRRFYPQCLPQYQPRLGQRFRRRKDAVLFLVQSRVAARRDVRRCHGHSGDSFPLAGEFPGVGKRRAHPG
ncbi:MAG: L-histidine N(alpha)-methyltransferase [Deltaproteobacteria bacterium]|nr:L-histidine N(alpha)-methyltransferase [Deltaproteobacteria bacterium]